MSPNGKLSSHCSGGINEHPKEFPVQKFHLRTLKYGGNLAQKAPKTLHKNGNENVHVKCCHPGEAAEVQVENVTQHKNLGKQNANPNCSGIWLGNPHKIHLSLWTPLSRFAGVTGEEQKWDFPPGLGFSSRTWLGFSCLNPGVCCCFRPPSKSQSLSHKRIVLIFKGIFSKGFCKIPAWNYFTGSGWFLKIPAWSYFTALPGSGSLIFPGISNCIKCSGDVETQGQLLLSSWINGKMMNYVSWEKSAWVSTEATSLENQPPYSKTRGKTGSKENQEEVTAHSWQEKMSQPKPERCKLSGFKRLFLQGVKSLLWDKRRFSLKCDHHDGSVQEREC